jgi:TPR repeat protein
MLSSLRHGAWLVALSSALWLPCQAADVGGWYADQQKAAAVASAKADDAACPQVIARAAVDPSALAAYRAALCYLQAEAPDVVAAKAWLGRSADMGFMPAHRVLRALLVAEAGVHSAAPHCHVLGEGQQICHGGSLRLPVAAAK